MSIDSSEFASQNTNSSGNRAPPPPFSSQTFTQSRKRPALSNLGIEVSLASDVKTPNTPTPNFTNDPLDSSDAVLKVRPTPTPPTDSNYEQHNSYNQGSHYQETHNYHQKQAIREPQLTTVLDALSDFQHFYDQKTLRIENMEIHLRHLNDLLHQREAELQVSSKERIENLRTLESNKIQLKELERKLTEFNKYEKMISTKFDSLESLMNEMSLTKAKYSQKETELKKELEGREIKLNEALRSIQEFRIEKESLEIQRSSLENENKDRCTEFNGKIYELSTEIKDKKRLIELLSGEKEVLLSDLKNITKDRDKIQRESSMALKEITELAISETISGCSSKDLGSLECSVAWLKGKCLGLNDFKIANDMEIANLRQTIQKLEKVAKTKNDELETKTVEIDKLTFDLDEFVSIKVIMDNSKKEMECLKDFKVKIKELGFQDDLNLYDKIYEKLKLSSDPKYETEAIQIKKKHEQELIEQKEEYGKLLREENFKWNLQREELENEISILKKMPIIKTTNQKSSHDADLTAFIKDLKESADTLSSTGKTQGKRTTASTNSSNIRFNNNKRRATSNTSNTLSQNSQKMSSPSSANSNDIWSLFK